MKKQESQQTYIEHILLNYGRISRNRCLEERITRLGAYVNILNNSGWEIKGRYEKKNGGLDFVYELISSPFKKVIYKIDGMNKEIIRYEK